DDELVRDLVERCAQQMVEVERSEGRLGDREDRAHPRKRGFELGTRAALACEERELRLLGLAALGEVARDLRESDEHPLLVTQRRDVDTRPEQRAIFTDAPAFFLIAAFLGRDAELV